MSTRVLFYYDVVSPWSMFAYQILKRYQKPWNLNLVLKPVFLGGIMAGTSLRSSHALFVISDVELRNFPAD